MNFRVGQKLRCMNVGVLEGYETAIPLGTIVVVTQATVSVYPGFGRVKILSENKVYSVGNTLLSNLARYVPVNDIDEEAPCEAGSPTKGENHA